MAIVYDDEGLPYETEDPFGAAIFYTNPQLDYTPAPGWQDPSRPALPQLTTANPTRADLDLYNLLQQAYGSGTPDDILPGLQNGNIWVGGQTIWDAMATGQLTDPGLWAYARNVTSNQQQTDQFSFLGDQFFPAVALLGAAVGGAALAGGFAAPAAGGAATTAGLGNIYGVELAAGGTLAAGGGTSAGGLIVPAAAGAGAVGAGTAGGVAAGAGTAAGTGGAGAATGAGGTVAGAGSTLGTLGTIAGIAGPAISGVTGLVGAVNSGNAATDAARIQADAARDANQLIRDIYTQNRADLGPYRDAGYASLGQLQSLAGQGQPQLTQNAPLNASQYAFQPSVQAPLAANHTFTPREAVNANWYQFNNPVGNPNAANYAFQAPTLTDDPGYKWRLEQGQKALERNLAAQGKYLSGQALKELTEYGQGAASQEYAAAYQRALGENQLRYGRDVDLNQLAYDRALTENQQMYQRGMETNEQAYQRELTANTLGYDRDIQTNQLAYQRGLTENQLGYERGYAENRDTYQRQLDLYNANAANQSRQYGQYATLAQLGSGATSATAQLGSQYGAAAGENLLGAANAQAAGQIGSANAFNQGLSSVGNAAQQYLDYLLLSQRG